MNVLQPSPRALPQRDPHGVTLALAQGGHFSVQALETTLFRVRYCPASGYLEPRTWAIAPGANPAQGQDAPWEGRARDDLQGFALPPVEVHENETGVSLATNAISVHMTHAAPAPLGLVWRNAAGQVLLRDRATSAYFRSTRTGAVRHYLARDRAERYYGLGDKTGPLDLHGRRLRTLALDALGYDPAAGDPLYKHWPFTLTRTASGQWVGLYYDTLAACIFDLGCEHDNYHDLYRYVEIDDGDLDYYLMFGDSPAAVIAQFVRLIGGTQLPPRWSLGYAQTAMGLADAPDAQAQLSSFIERAQAEGVPVSSFHYGSGYTSRGKRRYVFTWNREKFPDPQALNQRFQAAGMRLVANLKPCLLDDHPAYDEVRRHNGFIHHQDSTEPVNEPVVEQFWDGVGAHLDFTQPSTIAWWQAGLAQQVLDYGIDVGWNDNNEYAVMDDSATCAGFGQSLPMHRARPLHPMLMTRATYEAQARRIAEQTPSGTPGEAVYTITRGGSPGVQRYAQTWSGDNTTSWETLRGNLRTGLQMSLSGLFNIGHDVGGFAGPVPEPELLVRWVQACCLNPRMVMNSWKADGTVNLPWMHASVKAEVIAAIRLRYMLMPYLWRLFERAHTHSEPIIRPTFFNFPLDEACYADCDDFMLGDDVLVAPVVTAGATQRQVYLPGGRKESQGLEAWYDFETGEELASGQLHCVAAPLGKLPLFVRAGATLPLAHNKGEQGPPRFDDPVSELRRFGRVFGRG